MSVSNKLRHVECNNYYSTDQYNEAARGLARRNVGRVARKNAFEATFRLMLILSSSCWEARKLLGSAGPLRACDDSEEYVLCSYIARSYVDHSVTVTQWSTIPIDEPVRDLIMSSLKYGDLQTPLARAVFHD